MSESSQKADELLDLRGTPCPINFVRTKLKLEQMSPDAVLEVWLDSGEPIEQVPNSLKIEGYNLQEIAQRDGFFSLLVSRSATASRS